ncbi:hypothetical protein [Silanimonas sp.]|uniref:hypothetical protein n=1 Tax=Silanimonas sp. TaxID=1929290 RepID=UPI0037CC24F2
MNAALPSDALRTVVRDGLLGSRSFVALGAKERRALAQALVTIGREAEHLVADEDAPDERPSTPSHPRQAPVAFAQSNPPLPGAHREIARTTRNIMNAVSFPRFVNELLNGVFQAMTSANMQQMQAYVDLLGNVAATAEGFAQSQFSDAAAGQWLMERFPGVFEMDDGRDAEERREDAADAERDAAREAARAARRGGRSRGRDADDAEDDAPTITLRLVNGARMPSEAALRAAFGLGPEASLDASSPRALLPAARRHVARQRQQMLATMVQMGMQRIVVDQGRINAAMRFHIDTRDAANRDSASTTDFRHSAAASGSFGAGPWGVSATASHTIGYVSTQREQTTSEMNTDLDLSSSVEIAFRTENLPLNRMTTTDAAERIRGASLNPEAESAAAQAAATARGARVERQRTEEATRRTETAAAARPRDIPAMTVPPVPEPADRQSDRPPPEVPTAPNSGATTTPNGGGGGAGAGIGAPADANVAAGSDAPAAPAVAA